MSTRAILLIYLLVINILGLAAMAYDKIRAMERRFRIPESVLFILALIGGSLGCIIGMHLFRHKRRKPAFAIGLPLIFIVQVAAWIALRTTMQVFFM
ncbi:MAG: DUF1294 domain-containing protein [Eubacteriales bacterium]|nr:DUF1294 domain-containing protein [Eubacteriales bacterium]